MCAVRQKVDFTTVGVDSVAIAVVGLTGSHCTRTAGAAVGGDMIQVTDQATYAAVIGFVVDAGFTSVAEIAITVAKTAVTGCNAAARVSTTGSGDMIAYGTRHITPAAVHRVGVQIGFAASAGVVAVTESLVAGTSAHTGGT